jgi:hypothetical protein
MAYGTVNADVIGTSVAGSNLGAGNASIMKNRIINGSMTVDQRNAGASVTPTDGQFITDRFQLRCSQASKFTAQQNQGSVTPPVGFSNYLGFTSSSAYSIGSSDYFMIRQAIEGFNFADLQWGTANAKTITLSFWVRSSLTGTFGGCLQNSANDRAYPFTYSISSANTWTQASITVAGDTTGTWVGATNGTGIILNLGLGVGSTYSGTAGSWAGANYFSATGATSVVGTNGATFYITGVQLEVGSSATGFEYRQYGQELALCQRYFEMNVSQGQKPADGITTSDRYPFCSYSTGAGGLSISYKVEKRAGATITLYGGSNAYSSAGQLTLYVSGWTQTTGVTLGSISTTTNFNIDGQKTATFIQQNAYIAQPVWTASAEL